MRYLFFILGLSGLLSCVSTPKAIENWPAIAYPGFTEKINRLAGESAINCGLIDRVDSQKKAGLNREISNAQKCVDKAISENLPFKVGSFRIATTSYLYEVAVKSNSSDYWVILFDRAMDDSENLHFVKRCKSLSLNLREADFMGDGCVDVPTDDWLSDIPSTD
jgi:hypothetical protein